jgi:TRAP-type C4-dicarboxylate transport system substrate-binding protein
VINPPFYQVDVATLVHMNAWNKLPKDLQDVLNASVQEMEREAFDHFMKLISQDREKIKKKGVQELSLPGEESGKYLEIAYEAAWKEVLKKDPQSGAQLRDLLSK